MNRANRVLLHGFVWVALFEWSLATDPTFRSFAIWSRPDWSFYAAVSLAAILLSLVERMRLVAVLPNIISSQVASAGYVTYCGSRAVGTIPVDVAVGQFLQLALLRSVLSGMFAIVAMTVTAIVLRRSL